MADPLDWRPVHLDLTIDEFTSLLLVVGYAGGAASVRDSQTFGLSIDIGNVLRSRRVIADERAAVDG